MSDDPGQQQISEEELRAYLSQLRDAPLTDVVAQTVSILLNAAQVKLGRPDGRALIDIVAAVRDAARDQLDERLVEELDNALTQLRMAQVEAEAGGGAPTAPPSGDTGAEAPPSQGPGPDSSSQGGDAGSRLWVPGR